MGVLENKIHDLNRLEEEYKREREQVIEAIRDTVRSVGQNPAITPLGKNAFSIPVSQLINAPWEPAFHDWTAQAERLLGVLEKRPVNQWVQFIEVLLKKSTSGWSGVTVDKVLLNKKFLTLVFAKLQ